MHEFYAKQSPETAAADSLLAYLYEAEHVGQAIRVTDLVRAERFGTLPTVNRRLKELTAGGLVEMAVGTDRRTRVVRVTPKGERVLENRNALLLAAEANGARQAAFAAQN